jgi:hypothetical protein
MADDFNAMFNRITKKAEARTRAKRKTKPKVLDLGSTEAGFTQVNQRPPNREPRDLHGLDHRGSYKVRQYGKRNGAVKGRGTFGGIRK